MVNERKGEGGWGGWGVGVGTGKGTGKSMHTRLSKLPFSKLPFSFSPTNATSHFFFSGARGPPQFLRKRSENAGANENLSCGFPSIPGIAPGVAPRILGFVLLKS